MSETEKTLFPLSRNNRKNTVISSPTGEEIYWIETTTKILGDSQTYIYKPTLSGEGRELVARLEFHQTKKDLIEYGEATRHLNDLLIKKTRWFGTTRLMNTDSGQWEWTGKLDRPELFSAEPEHRLLVKYHFNFHLTSHSTPALEVDAEAIPYMDLIVIGWVVMTRDIENMSQGPKLG